MVISSEIDFSTRGSSEIVDLTGRLREALKESGLRSGLMNVFAVGSTGAVTTMEYEPGLEADLKSMVDELIPASPDHAHNRTWGDGNAHSHLRASLIGPEVTIPFREGEMLLGTWQQVVFVDFDVRPRDRRLHVQIVGD